MQRITYAKELRGRLTAVGPGLADVELTAADDNPLGTGARLVTQLSFADERSFDVGTIAFGGDEALRLTTLGQGDLADSPEGGIKHGTAVLEVAGTGRLTGARVLLHLFFDSVLTGPTGKSIRFDAHQNAELTASGVNTLTGQGPNVRLPHFGLIYQDVGRLVFDDATGETLFASAKSVSFDDPAAPEKLAAAICAAVG